ncbi:MAG: hypothetical protein WKF71_16030 [Pyrinomonadaceae bacterium]
MNIFVIEPTRYLVAAVKGFFSVPLDLPVADSAAVKNVAVTGYGQAPHRLILFGEPVKKLVEFSFVRRLCVSGGKQRQCQ